MREIGYEKWVFFPTTRIRVEIGTDRGDMAWFVVQLEYDLDWDYGTSKVKASRFTAGMKPTD